MANLVPPSALQILEKTLDTIRIRANADGEVFGGQIMDAMREAGACFGVDRLEILLVRTVLVRAMESLGEDYPAEVLQNHETRMRVSDAIRYLREAIERQRTFAQTSFEGLAFQKFHDEVVNSVLVADIVQYTDVSMLKG